MVWVSSPKSCPFDIQPEALEQFDGVIQAVAPAGNQFELIVESFDKAAGLPPLKIVEDPLLPMREGVKKRIKAGEACGLDRLAPPLEAGLCGRPIRGTFKNGGQHGT